MQPPSAIEATSRKLNEAPPAGAGELYLLCRARTRWCALRLEHLVETMRPLPVQTLPDLPSFILGVSVIRGSPTPIVDPGALFDCQERGSPTRIVTLRTGTRVVGLAVEQVAGIRAIPTSTISELPSLLRSARSDAVHSLLALDEELVVVLDAARVVPDSAWSLIGRPAS